MKNTDFKKLPSKELNGGIQYLFRAENNYGASIVKHLFSYGRERGLWELAVVYFNNVEDNSDYKIVYDTPITDDVLGYLSEDEVNETLVKIAELI